MGKLQKRWRPCLVKLESLHHSGLSGEARAKDLTSALVHPQASSLMTERSKWHINELNDEHLSSFLASNGPAAWPFSLGGYIFPILEHVQIIEALLLWNEQDDKKKSKM